MSEKEVLALNEDFFNKKAANYEEKINRVFGNYSQKRMDNVVKFLASLNNNYFIDLGCGTGNLLKYGHKYFKKAIGYDISKNMLLIARKKGLKVKKRDIHNLDIKDNEVDVVASCGLLHHILYPKKVLKEMSRVTKKNGTIYLENEENSLFLHSKIWGLYFKIRNIIERKENEAITCYTKSVNPDYIKKELINLDFKPKFYFHWTSNNIFKKEQIPFKRKLLIFLISLLRMRFGAKHNSPLFIVIAQKSA